ncbi:hypothetical protein NUU61_002925 [Penicillium alfredii]|uniref:Uncharacterized protein n=1 Tax=Penicillium alfredii TaxID=1506179 RepID=A0A9W9FSJ0_9EURO|nr:uncharacterized protein NUU61_002925 [Penicillium alfredii]KAJ5105578.1 hypothetical protein NUU61_002925 [Penicillium alfredii]
MTPISDWVLHRWTKTVFIVSLVLWLFLSSNYHSRHPQPGLVERQSGERPVDLVQNDPKDQPGEPVESQLEDQRLDSPHHEIRDESTDLVQHEPRKKRRALAPRDDWNGRPITWSVSLSTGKMLDCAMNADEQQEISKCFQGKPVQATSPYTQYEQLNQWGWDQSSLPQQDYLEELSEATNRLDEVQSWLGHNLKQKSRLIIWDHSKTVTKGGKTYDATRGIYKGLYNAVFGFIIVLDVSSPRHAVSKMSCPPENVVELEKWSDVTALQWGQLLETLKDAVSLKNLIYAPVTNTDSVRTMREALGVEASFSEWQNYAEKRNFKKFSRASNDKRFFALLGSPSVRGAAWMLIQHRPIFGHWRVASITIFGNQVGVWKPGLIVELEPVK